MSTLQLIRKFFLTICKKSSFVSLVNDFYASRSKHEVNTMKSVKKYSKQIPLLATFVMLMFSNNALAKLNKKPILSSSAGYPYNLLIQRSDEVLLSYQGDELVQCRVEVKWNKQSWQGIVVQVQAEKFLPDPLKSCLPRHMAKDMLAATFDQP
jgi:hypothetical protein